MSDIAEPLASRLVTIPDPFDPTTEWFVTLDLLSLGKDRRLMVTTEKHGQPPPFPTWQITQELR